MDVWRACSTPACSMVTGGRGLRNRYPANAGYEHMKQAGRTARRRRRRSPPARSRQGRRQAHLRQAHRPLSLRHQARRRPARAPGHSRHQHLQHALREGIRQPLPEFLSGERLRDGRRCQPAQRQAHQPESVELRPLQDLRHRRPVPDHHLGSARGRRRAELRRHVIPARSCDGLSPTR